MGCRTSVKIMQIFPKTRSDPTSNEYKQTWILLLQWQKTFAVHRHTKVHENAFIFVVPDVALLKHWVPKSCEIIENKYKLHRKTKNMIPGVAMAES